MTTAPHIGFKLYGKLVSEPRRDELTRELMRAQAQREIDKATDPHMREFWSNSLASYNDPATRVGAAADGRPFTRLRLLSAGEQHVEVIAYGKLAIRAAALEPGAWVTITGLVQGNDPHLRLVALRVAPDLTRMTEEE